MNVRLYGGTNGGRVIDWPQNIDVYNLPEIIPRPVRAFRIDHTISESIALESYRLTPFYFNGRTSERFRAFAGVLIGYELTGEDEREIFRNLQVF